MPFNQKWWKGSDTIAVKKLFSSVRFLGIEKSFSFLKTSQIEFIPIFWKISDNEFSSIPIPLRNLCVIYTNEGSKKILIKTRGRGTNAIELKLISSSEKSEKEKSNQEGRSEK